MAFEVVENVARLREAVGSARWSGKSIGFVPTMGALHAGHASLLHIARQECTYVVASTFVNPKQFVPKGDFTRYPRTWDADVALCTAEEVDLIFAPSVDTVYPPGFRTQVEVTELQDVLCGASRPGHFRGVATVVLKLFNMVQPDLAYFGQKDAQQVCIIQKMVRDLDLPVKLRVCPTIREADGLALSSRNRYLSPAERPHATCLYRSLRLAEDRVAGGERDACRVRQAMIDLIRDTPGAGLEYVALVDPQTLQPIVKLGGEVLALVAVRFGTTRLIDNCLLRT